MKLFGRLVLVLALLSGVAYAKKVKLFDLSKHQLKSKNENKLETYKVGNIIVKTDLKYHEDNEMYFTGSRMHVYMDNFEGVSFLYKRHIHIGYHPASNGKITFSDDFGESVEIGYRGDWLFPNNNEEYDNKEYKVGSQSSIKLEVNGKEVLVFNGKKQVAKLSTAHMESIVSYEHHFGIGGTNKKAERIYKFIIFGENKEVTKKAAKK